MKAALSAQPKAKTRTTHMVAMRKQVVNAFLKSLPGMKQCKNCKGYVCLPALFLCLLFCGGVCFPPFTQSPIFLLPLSVFFLRRAIRLCLTYGCIGFASHTNALPCASHTHARRHAPALRKDGASKIFLQPLADKQRRVMEAKGMHLATPGAGTEAITVCVCVRVCSCARMFTYLRARVRVLCVSLYVCACVRYCTWCACVCVWVLACQILNVSAVLVTERAR